MNWSTEKAKYTSVLTGAGYSEIPQLKAVEETAESFNHKAYQIFCDNLTDFQQTSTSVVGQVAFTLEITYRNANASQYDANIQLINDLADLLKDVSGFMGYDGKIEISFYDEYKLKATFPILIGVRVC